MSVSASVTHEIPFHDIDIMEIVWHGHYFKYFEMARTKLMQKFELDWTQLRDLGYAMPIIDCNAKYRQSTPYGTIINIEAKVSEFEYPSLDIDYKISSPLQEIHVTGKTRQIYLEIETLKPSFNVPEEILTRFQMGFKNE
ncbi:MAG: acyl-CoA thioesterase [Deltaproteobacteria bacterium]|nr:acyl-CoA thioesterase [Deltaproteobacteria bacterium]